MARVSVLPAVAASVTSRNRHLFASAAMHTVNDALFAGVYPLLPLIAAEMGLTYAQTGAIKTVLVSGSAMFQVPAGMLAERIPEHLLLAAGTGWAGAGFLGMAAVAGFWWLLVASLVAGLGGNIQHPVGTAVISRVFDGGGRATAIGTLNFAGDMGKVLAPLIVGAAMLAGGWRAGLLTLGIVGTVFAACYAVSTARLAVPITPAPSPDSLTRDYALDGKQGNTLAARWGIHRPGLFAVLALIGVLDSAARGASLTFIPFLLADKGLEPASMSFYFTAIFAAGAAGKFLCGPLADRFGNVAVIAITELVTAGCLVALLGIPAAWVLAAILPLGFVLNGTSSVLYASVAPLVDPSKRGRGYGLYFTASQMASALAPLIYGLVADRAGLGVTFVAMAVATGLIAPVALVAGRELKG